MSRSHDEIIWTPESSYELHLTHVAFLSGHLMILASQMHRDLPLFYLRLHLHNSCSGLPDLMILWN